MGEQTLSSPGSLKQTFVRVAPATLVTQLLSFGSAVILASTLGAHTQTDAYYLALSVPGMVYILLLAAVRLGAIPILTAATRNQDKADFSRASSEFITAAACAALALSVLSTAAMIFLIPAAAAGSAHLSHLTREYLVELIPYPVTGAMEGGLSAILAVKGRFGLPTLLLGFEPVVKSVLLVLFHRQLGAQALVLGNVGGNALAVLCLWRLCLGTGVRIRPASFRSSAIVRRTLKLSVPMLIGQSVVQLNPVIDRVTAAPLGPGTVTVFELGSRLFMAPSSLLGASLVAPLAATWSARLASDGWDAVTASLRRTAAVVLIATLPMIVVGYALRHDLTSFAFGSHAYGPAAVTKTANVFGMLLLSLPAQLLIVPLSTLFIIRGNTVFTMKMGFANGLLNAALDLLLRHPLGVSGIALSTTVTLSILFLGYLWQAHRKWGALDLVRLVRPVVVSLLSCAVLVAAYLLVARRVHVQGGRLDELAWIAAVGAFAACVQGVSVVVGRAWPDQARGGWAAPWTLMSGAVRSLIAQYGAGR